MFRSDRIKILGSGVFARNDRRKNLYQLSSPQYPLFDLSLGSTDLPPPEEAISAIRESLGDLSSSGYCLQSGTLPFREAATSWVERRFGISVDVDKEVLFLVGSQEGTAHLPMSIMNSGDTGLILDPSYPSHRGGMLLAEARIETLKLLAEKQWRPDFSAFTNSQWDQMKMMILGFPHNPTAQVGKQCWLEEAIAIGLRHQVVVAHDNPYVDLALEGEAPVLLRCEGWRECGVEFFSLSKAWCLGGFRLGFAIGAAPIISALRELKGVVDFNQSLALQQGAIAALNATPNWPEKMLDIYRERRDKTLEAFRCLGWEIPSPSMALYLWLPIPDWANEYGLDDEMIAAEILRETGIALTPGSGFGVGGSGWLRLALVKPAVKLEQAISRLAPWWNKHA